MLTVRTLGGTTVSCTSGEGSLLVFPQKIPEQASSEKSFVLLSVPEQRVHDGSVVSWPGEYDRGGIAVRGIGHMTESGAVDPFARHVSYVATIDGLRCGFLSSPLHSWNEQEIELLGDLDVLMIPADDVKLVQHIVEEVDPRIVIPLPSKDGKAYQETLRACGVAGAEPVKEVKLKKGGLPTDSRAVYALATA